MSDWDDAWDTEERVGQMRDDPRRARSRRVFVDAPAEIRCLASIVRRDYSQAQCGRRRREGSDYCTQHTQIAAGESVEGSKLEEESRERRAAEISVKKYCRECDRTTSWQDGRCLQCTPTSSSPSATNG